MKRFSFKISLLLLFAHSVLSFLLFQFGRVPKIVSLARGEPLLDNNPNYSAKYAYELFNAIGAEGRQLYSSHLWQVDLLYALFTGLVFWYGLHFCVQELFPTRRWASYLPLLSVSAALFDIAENIGLLTVISQFPGRLDGVILAIGYVTMTKLILVNALFLLLLAGLMAVIGRNIFRKRKTIQAT